MLPLNRREFLGQSVVAAGALAGLAALPARSSAAGRSLAAAGDLVTLGRSGVTTSLLGIGTGSHGVGRTSNQVKLGQEKFNRLLAHAFDRGIRYIDTADQYGSHIFVREAIKAAKMPREKLFIQTKTRALNAEVAKADLERFREELGTDHIDSLLMHCMTKQSWPNDMRPVMDVLDDAKAKGLVKAVGVSCHGLPPLQVAAATDWIDIDLARINPLGGNKGRMDSTPQVVAGLLKRMHDKGKGILGMKILAEGDLKTKEAKLESLKFAIGLGCVDAFVIGFEKPEQIDEICGLIEDVLKVA